MRSPALLLVACALTSAASAQTSLDLVDLIEDPVDHECGGCGKAQMLRKRAALGLPISEEGPRGYMAREAMTDTDVLGYVLDIEVFPTTSVISGSNTITVRSLVNNLTQFTFMLRDQYTVSQILMNGTTPVTATTPGANSYARRITLDRAYNAGEVFTIKITYSGTAVSRGFGSIDFNFQNEDNTRPRIVETLSEAYFAATWWPCKDGDVFVAGDNSDKATMDISITAPSIYKTTANGLLQSVTTPAAGKSKYRYVTNYPTATYLVAFSTTVYNSWTQNYVYPLPGGGTGTMPVEFNIYPAYDTPGNRAAWERCIPMLAAFRPYYGEYPFINEKYGIYQFNFGGGMEHQTNSGQGTFNESVTAHELAHQWWGDNVTCKTWSDIWLNEGFATYSEALWEETKPGSSGLSSYLNAMAVRAPATVGDSVYVYDASDMNRIFSSTYSYRKGAWVLHMLRKVVGDGVFYTILNTYRTTYEGSAATTDDFTAVASQVSGMNLTPFIRQWVYGIGAPAYVMGTQAVTINGQNYLNVRLRQTQNASWPGAGAPAGYFAMPIDLRITTSTNTGTVTLNNNARTQHFIVPYAGTLSSVELDPLGWVLKTNVGTEAYQAGPPVILESSAAPGQSFGYDTPAFPLQVAFSQPVNAPMSAFALTGPSGPVAFSYSYDAGLQLSTLNPIGGIEAGEYTLSISGVTAASGGMTLDGEVPGLNGAPWGFPSGNGVAGGGASWSFTVEPMFCSSDFDGDGDFGTDADIEAFFSCLAGHCCATCFAGGADFDGDGDTGTDADIEAFFRTLAGGNC